MSRARPDLTASFDEGSPAGRSGLTLATLSDADSFSKLAKDWDELVRSMPRPSPYLLHGWLSEWWRHFGAEGNLRVQVAHRDGRLVSALPLCLRSRHGVKALEFVGGGGSMLADVLLADGEEPSTAALLVRRAAASGHHFADLFGMPEGGLLHEALGSRDLRLVARSEAPVLDLTPDWETVYREKTSKKRRSLHRRRRRQLSALGTLETSVAHTEAELEAAIEDAFLLHERRWQGGRDTSGFVTDRGKQFERAALRVLAQIGVPRIVLLRLDGQAIAFSYTFVLERRLYAHKLAFDPRLGRHSPGVLNVLDTLALAAEEGLTRVEFLGGAERFKVELADRFEPLYEGIGMTNGAVGLAAAATRLRSVRLRLRLKRSPAARWIYGGVASSPLLPPGRGPAAQHG